MKYQIHRASSRGVIDQDWLQSSHSFSFGSYHDPERMGFGLLRVLNDDVVAPGKGFDTHPHCDMEIVSIPLQGTLYHKDSVGHEQRIQPGEVQLMSAGTGVYHSEYNASDLEHVNFLQIWVMPDKKGIAPRYDQKKFTRKDRQNQLQTIVSPIDSGDGGVKINQQAYFSLLDLDMGARVKYSKKWLDNGVYIFLLEGEVRVAGVHLHRRDAIAVENSMDVEILGVSAAQLLMIDVPLREL
ncbi:MAG: pirin family protein [Zetaproteobacteria bacterium]|nr:pirin family protein [Zetaproteobacteria bacterium]